MNNVRNVAIRSRLGETEGWANDVVAFFDCFDPRARRMVRHFVLLQESTKLVYEPFGWKNRWYIDLVGVTWADANTIELTDLYLDVIVEGNGPTYRMIDIEELADALVNREVSLDTMYQPMHCLQRFLDDHLHGGKDFPPRVIQPYLEGSLEEPANNEKPAV